MYSKDINAALAFLCLSGYKQWENENPCIRYNLPKYG
jgi:hypothetical protein